MPIMQLRAACPIGCPSVRSMARESAEMTSDWRTSWAALSGTTRRLSARRGGRSSCRAGDDAQAESAVEEILDALGRMRRGRPEGHREDALPLPCVEVCADARLAVRERHDCQLQAAVAARAVDDDGITFSEWRRGFAHGPLSTLPAVPRVRVTQAEASSSLGAAQRD